MFAFLASRHSAAARSAAPQRPVCRFRPRAGLSSLAAARLAKQEAAATGARVDFLRAALSMNRARRKVPHLARPALIVACEPALRACALLFGGTVLLAMRGRSRIRPAPLPTSSP